MNKNFLNTNHVHIKQVSFIFFPLVILTTLTALWQIKIPLKQQEVTTDDVWKLPVLSQSTQKEALRKLRQHNPWGPEEAVLSEAEKRREARIAEANKRREEREKKAKKKKEQREAKKRRKEQEKQKALELAEQRRLAEAQRIAEEEKRQQQKLLKQNFIGIVQQGDQGFILLLKDNSTVHYPLGSDLPGYGVRLKNIYKDFIEVQRGDEIETIALYNDEHLKKKRPISTFKPKETPPIASKKEKPAKEPAPKSKESSNE